MLKSALSLVLVALCGTAASFGELLDKFPTLGGYVGLSDWWREHAVSPVDDGSHWNANGESLCLIGDAMGRGLAKMLTP